VQINSYQTLIQPKTRLKQIKSYLFSFNEVWIAIIVIFLFTLSNNSIFWFKTSFTTSWTNKQMDSWVHLALVQVYNNVNKSNVAVVD